MRRLLLIANPAASSFTSSLHRDVVEILEHTNHVTSVWPNSPAEARTEAAAAAAAGIDIVAAMGGDGIVHEVANGIIGTTAALGVIPAGTTNVVRRILGLPRKPRDAAEALAASSTNRILETLTLLRGLGGHLEEHVVSFAAGVGFDAEVIQESERRPLAKVGFGALHYARSDVVSVGLSYTERHPTIRVTDGTRTADAVAVLLQLHDEFTYLGRFPMSLATGPKPVAAIVTRTTAPRLVSLAVRAAFGGDLERVRGVEIWRGFEQIDLDIDPAEWCEADGELLGKADSIRVTASGQALLVVDAGGTP